MALGQSAILDFLDSLAREFGTDGGTIRVLEGPPRPLRASFPPGCHVHESWEVRVCRGGNYFLKTPYGEISLPDRSLLLVPPGTVHIPHGQNLRPQSRKVQCLYITLDHGRIVAGVQDKAHNVHCLLAPERCARVPGLGFLQVETSLSIIAATHSTSARRNTYCENLLRVLFSSLAELVGTPEPPSIHPSRQAAAQALDYLRVNYYQPHLSLRDVAKHVGLARTYLAGLFSKHHGRTLRQTLIELRLEKANALLLQRAYSVKEVAHLTGWSSQLYFSRVFHRKFGFPPSRILHA